MEDLLDLGAPIATEEWGFEADFVAEATEFAPPPANQPASVAEDADHLAWAFALAVRDDDLGVVDGIDVRERLQSIIRVLAQGPADSESIDEIAMLRDACRWNRQWTSSGFEWPVGN